MDWDCNFNCVTLETEETPVTDVTADNGQAPVELSAADEQVLRELTVRARTGGLKLTGEGGLPGPARTARLPRAPPTGPASQPRPGR